MKLVLRQRLLGTTLLVGVAAFGTPAFAQTAGQPQNPAGDNSEQTTSPVEGTVATDTSATGANQADAGSGNEIIVTGSRIPQPNLTSTSPVTVVSAGEVKIQGTSRVEDLLNTLPQVFADQGSTDANGATGIATVSLRGLGAARTLVLINGRRLVPGDPTSPVADLNFIPAAIIKRVDVLTGGASSVYGSDALAGVVNFIMDTDFSGVRIEGQVSTYNHDNRTSRLIRDANDARNFDYPKGMVTDGLQRNLTVSFGTDVGGDNRGHILAYASYRKVAAVTSADRDFSSCGLSGSLDPDVGVVCGGSSTAATGRFRRTQQTGSAGGKPIYGAFGPSVTVDPAGGFRPFSNIRDRFNFNPFNYFQRPDERYTFGLFGHYEVSDAFVPYVEAMFMDDRTLAQIAPSGAFFGTDFFVNCDNPLLTAAQQTTLCAGNAGTNTLQSLYIGRRNVEGGPRIDDLKHQTYRIVLGTRGDIAPGIAYDAYAQYGRALLSEEYRNDFSRARLNRSLNVVINPATNLPACASAIPNGAGQVLDANCVPYNIFAPGGVTQEALDYLQTPGFRSGTSSQIVVNAALTARLGEYGVQSPWSERGVAIAFGAEYRKDSLETRNDISFLTGDLAGQGTPFGVPNSSGFSDVKEIFGEIEVPIASGRPGFYDLTLSASGRRSKYNLAGVTNSYKLAAEYSPTADAKLRASYNRAVRAPNVLDLFTPPTVGLFSTLSDPCSGGVVSGTTLDGGGTIAQCLNTFLSSGLTPAQATAALIAGIDASSANQYNQRTAGNPNLKPEIGDSYTLGIVLTPKFLPRFNASIDAFDIRVKKTISSVGASFTLNQCVETANPFFCNRIVRSSDGSLFTGPSFVDNPTENLGSLRTRGIDINVNYRTPTLFGGPMYVSFDLVGTYLDKFVVEPIAGANGVGKYDCAGYFGDSCGTPNAKWRHKFRTTLAVNKVLSVSGAWRHFASVKNDLDSKNELIGTGPGSALDAGVTEKIKAQNYFDLAAVAAFNKYTLRIGAQNILDRQPPVTPGYSNNASNTFAQVYDALGRYLYASVTLDF